MMRWHFDPINVERLHHDFGAGHIVGFVLMAILWAVVIAALVIGIRALILHSRRSGPSTMTPDREPTAAANPPASGTPAGITPVPAPGAPSMLKILEERYAKGEIDREEFLQRKQDLGLS